MSFCRSWALQHREIEMWPKKIFTGEMQLSKSGLCSFCCSVCFAKNAASPFYTSHLWEWVICSTRSVETVCHCSARTKGWDTALTTVLHCSCWHCGVLCINPMQIAPLFLSLSFFNAQTLPTSYIYTHKHTAALPPASLYVISLAISNCLTGKRQSASFFFFCT